MMQIMVPKSRITAIHVRFVVVAPQTTWAFVQLRTDGGVTGLGECSAAGSDATISDMVEAAARSLRHTRLDGEAQSALSELRSEWAPGRTWSVVLNAVELALDDAVCRLEGIPLHATIAPAVRTRVPLYANINRAARPRTPSPPSLAVHATRGIAASSWRRSMAPSRSVGRRSTTVWSCCGRFGRWSIPAPS
jgi:galactonate dehydratase